MRTSKSIQPGSTSLADKVFSSTIYRKLYHLVGGSLVILGFLLLDREWFIASCILYIVLFYLICKRISFAVIGFLMLAILTNSTVIMLSSAAIWLVGDGMAGLIGGAFGKRKWPWHSQKTILGSASFLAGAFLAVLVVLNSTIDAPLHILALLSILVSIGACIIEVMPVPLIKDRKVDDNLLLILSSALLITLLSSWFGLEIGL